MSSRKDVRHSFLYHPRHVHICPIGPRWNMSKDGDADNALYRQLPITPTLSALDTIAETPDWVPSVSQLKADGHVTLCIHKQEKGAGEDFLLTPAGFTCGECPQHQVWLHKPSGRRLRGLSWAPMGPWGHYAVDGSGHNLSDVERCSKCHRERTRWQRGRRQARAMHTLFGGERMRFITLTLPTREKSPDYHEAQDVRWLKVQIAKFRRTKAWKEHVVGSLEFYEYKESKGKHHTHVHMITIGKFWRQRELSESWGGRADIREVDSLGDAMRYVSNYTLKTRPVKDPDTGRSVRCRETWGACRKMKQIIEDEKRLHDWGGRSGRHVVSPQHPSLPSNYGLAAMNWQEVFAEDRSWCEFLASYPNYLKQRFGL